MLRFILILVTMNCWSFSALADECHCEQLTSAETLLVKQSNQGRALRLRIPESPVNTQSSLAYLCHEPSGTLTQARLWMPEHGHGSAPTRLVVTTPSCTRVERLRFSMAGAWELQLRYADGDMAHFTFEVQRP